MFLLSQYTRLTLKFVVTVKSFFNEYEKGQDSLKHKQWDRMRNADKIKCNGEYMNYVIFKVSKTYMS